MEGIPTLLSPKEAAAHLGTTYGTLAVWRCTRRHPLKFVRVGRKIFYTTGDIAAFIAAHTDPGDGPRADAQISKETHRAARKQPTRQKCEERLK